jgi:adenylylsulfate reductase subunit B
MPPVINPKKCKGCGNCADVCQCDVFFGSLKGKIPLITYPEECWHCNACVDACSVAGAIRLRIPLPLMVLYSERD